MLIQTAVTHATEMGGVALLAAALIKVVDRVVDKIGLNRDERDKVLETKVDNLNQTCRDGFKGMTAGLDRLGDRLDRFVDSVRAGGS